MCMARPEKKTLLTFPVKSDEDEEFDESDEGSEESDELGESEGKDLLRSNAASKKRSIGPLDSVKRALKSSGSRRIAPKLNVWQKFKFIQEVLWTTQVLTSLVMISFENYITPKFTMEAGSGVEILPHLHNYPSILLVHGKNRQKGWNNIVEYLLDDKNKHILLLPYTMSVKDKNSFHNALERHKKAALKVAYEYELFATFNNKDNSKLPDWAFKQKHPNVTATWSFQEVLSTGTGSSASLVTAYHNLRRLVNVTDIVRERDKVSGVQQSYLQTVLTTRSIICYHLAKAEVPGGEGLEYTTLTGMAVVNPVEQTPAWILELFELKTGKACVLEIIALTTQKKLCLCDAPFERLLQKTANGFDVVIIEIDSPKLVNVYLKYSFTLHPLLKRCMGLAWFPPLFARHMASVNFDFATSYMVGQAAKTSIGRGGGILGTSAKVDEYLSLLNDLAQCGAIRYDGGSLQIVMFREMGAPTTHETRGEVTETVLGKQYVILKN